MLEDADRAHAIYRSLGRNPTKLTILMRGAVDEEEEDAASVEEEEDGSEAEDICAGIEELRLESLDCTCAAHCRNDFYSGSLPYAALRVLELTGYILQPNSERTRPLTFPCLQSLRLWRCRTAIARLHDIIHAAPRLTHIHIKAVCFVDNQQEYHLHCPKATDIVIADLHTLRSGILFGGCTVKLDAPCVRRLRYTNVVTFEETQFSLAQNLPPYLVHVHMAVHSGSNHATLVRRSLLTSVSRIRFLKLTAYSMADLDDILQCTFFNLQRLEIEDLCGWCIRNDRYVAGALVKMLDRCPGVRDLHLKFSWREYLLKNTDGVDQITALSEFSPCRALVQDAEKKCCNALELHKLCCSSELECLESSLRKVVVEFDTEELTCLQVWIVKFIAKNAMVLEEFIFDGGKGYDSSHISCKISEMAETQDTGAASEEDSLSTMAKAGIRVPTNFWCPCS